MGPVRAAKTRSAASASTTPSFSNGMTPPAAPFSSASRSRAAMRSRCSSVSRCSALDFGDRVEGRREDAVESSASSSASGCRAEERMTVIVLPSRSDAVVDRGGPGIAGGLPHAGERSPRSAPSGCSRSATRRARGGSCPRACRPGRRPRSPARARAGSSASAAARALESSVVERRHGQGRDEVGAERQPIVRPPSAGPSAPLVQSGPQRHARGDAGPAAEIRPHRGAARPTAPALPTAPAAGSGRATRGPVAAT